MRLHLVPQGRPTFSRESCATSTIDHFAVPRQLLNSYTSCTTRDNFTPSDHLIVELCINAHLPEAPTPKRRLQVQRLKNPTINAAYQAYLTSEHTRLQSQTFDSVDRMLTHYTEAFTRATEKALFFHPKANARNRECRDWARRVNALHWKMK
jgi:hypothetical protein